MSISPKDIVQPSLLDLESSFYMVDPPSVETGLYLHSMFNAVEPTQSQYGHKGFTETDASSFSSVLLLGPLSAVAMGK